MEHTNTVEIIDLGECTALLTIGFTLIKLSQSKGSHRKIFLFDKQHPMLTNVTVEDTLEKYYRHLLQLDAISFYRNIRDMKSRIHDFEEMNKAV